ncbi:hypothetical protein B0O99DRAFT_596721 [Bisporella sp. PMI_857]|nr:hypothetical protein B0O99DRAFT_596721 [Bisporella sp. PMI_857]
MENLPIELRQNILQYVDLSSLKAIRQTSKAWADLGEEYLISPSFTALPCRSDMDRLLSISKHPKLSYRVQSVTINLGEVNEYHARHNIYFQNYMREYEGRVQAQEETWQAYSHLKVLKEMHLPDCCEESRLARIFASLPNLIAINVTLMTYPFSSSSSSSLEKIWAIPSSRLLPRVATNERFTAILSSLTTSRLHTLTHDRLPFEFFAQKAQLISLFASVFQPLTTLNLALDYSDMPNDLHFPQAFQNLAHCLRGTTSLQTLSLTFLSRKKISISPLLSALRSSEPMLAELSSLTLGGITATESELSLFLGSLHGLKHLQLGTIGLRAPHQPVNGGLQLREGSFYDLIANVKSQLNLDRFEAIGDLKAWPNDERYTPFYVRKAD